MKYMDALNTFSFITKKKWTGFVIINVYTEGFRDIILLSVIHKF